MNAVLMQAASCSRQLPSRATDCMHVEPLVVTHCQAESADVGPQVRRVLAGQAVCWCRKRTDPAARLHQQELQRWLSCGPQRPCRYIECLSLVRLPLSPEQTRQLHDSLDENLRHPKPDIQAAASAALKAFLLAYEPDSSVAALQRTTEKYLGGLHDPNVAVRRGCTAALGALPQHLCVPLAAQMIKRLAEAVQVSPSSSAESWQWTVHSAQTLNRKEDTSTGLHSCYRGGAQHLCVLLAAQLMKGLAVAIQVSLGSNAGPRQ